MLIKAVSISARNQYLIPYHYDSKYIQSVLLGVVVNLFSNILLIPRYGALGAVIGTLLAELAASAVQMAFICRKVNMKLTAFKCFFYIFSGFVMLIMVRVLAHFLHGGVLCLGLEIICGAISYCLVILIEYSVRNKQNLLLSAKQIYRSFLT